MKPCDQTLKMQLIYGLMFFLLCLPLQCLSQSTVNLSHPSIKIVCDPWPPWIEGEEGGNVTGGIFVEITRSLLAGLGIKAVFTLMPFTRVLNNIKSGNADMALMVSKTRERSHYGLYSSRILSSPFYFYALTPGPLTKWHSWQQLQPYQIGVTRNFNYGKEFIAASKKEKLSLYWSISEKASLALLIKKRLDLVILNQYTAQTLADTAQQGHEIKLIPPVVHDPDFYLFISKKSPLRHQVNLINRQIELMQQRGDISRTMEQYQKQ